MIPYVVAVTFLESEDKVPLRAWFPKTTGFADHYLLGVDVNVVAALYENHAYALNVHTRLLKEGYHPEDVDMFPSMKWSMHPMKIDFVKGHLLSRIERMAREEVGEQFTATPVVNSAVHALYFTGNAITGRDVARHAAVLSLHHRVHQVVMETTLQRVDLPELEPEHLELLNLKVLKILHQRVQRVNSMGLFAVGDEAEEKAHQCIFYTFHNKQVKVSFVGMLREVRAVIDRIRNIRPFLPATHTLTLPVVGDWECLHRNAVFQKNHTQRRTIETKHAVLITCGDSSDKKVMLSALTAEDAFGGSQAFQEMLSTYRKAGKVAGKSGKSGKDEEKQDPGC